MFAVLLSLGYADDGGIVDRMNYQVQRRKLLKIMAISAAAPVLRGQSAPTADQLKFFEPNQERIVDRLSEMIIPTDEHSPGASTAQVSLFIDEGLADGKEEDQVAWTAGLIAVETEARSRFSAPFLDCSDGQQDEILAEMALNEKTPKTDLQRFFGVLKAQTITGYYTSRAGLIEELEYTGIMPIAKFEACDHPEHKG